MVNFPTASSFPAFQHRYRGRQTHQDECLRGFSELLFSFGSSNWIMEKGSALLVLRERQRAPGDHTGGSD